MPIKEILKKFNYPELLLKYVELILEDSDYAFIEAASQDGFINKKLFTDEMLKKAYSRGIINKTINNEIYDYKLADFYTRLEFFLLEDKNRWVNLPKETKQELDSWYVEQFALRVLEEAKQNNGFRQEIVMPLEIAEAKIKAQQTGIAIQACDCRLFAENCQQPVNICIQFNPLRPNTVYDRGYGRLVSKEEALSLLKQADDTGLMHLGENTAICNCCACCCYPFRSALDNNTKGKWPVTPYIVEIDASLCINCGACVERCYFKALQSGEGKMELITEKCWGCGVCRAVCPTNAIKIKQRT